MFSVSNCRISRRRPAPFPHADDSLGMRIGERLEQDGIHKTENRGVGADAERQSQHGDGGEAGRFAQLKAAEGRKLAGQIANLIEPPGFTGKQPGEIRTQFGHRMGEWEPLKPALVAEVQYDHFTGGRFRHGAKFLRWRPDKNAEDSTAGQVRH